MPFRIIYEFGYSGKDSRITLIITCLGLMILLLLVSVYQLRSHVGLGIMGSSRIGCKK